MAGLKSPAIGASPRTAPTEIRVRLLRPGVVVSLVLAVLILIVAGLLGPYVIYECYTVNLHDLGTPAAGSQGTHLPDRTVVNSRYNALTPTPTISAGP